MGLKTEGHQSDKLFLPSDVHIFGGKRESACVRVLVRVRESACVCLVGDNTKRIKSSVAANASSHLFFLLLLTDISNCIIQL